MSAVREVTLLLKTFERAARFGALVVLLSVFQPSRSSAEPTAIGLQGRLQVYRDTRDFSTVNLTNRISGLPLHSQIFGYTNFNSRQGDPTEWYDLRETSSEYRLTSTEIGELVELPGLGLFGEGDYVSPGKRTIGRVGLSYRLSFDSMFVPDLMAGWIQTRVALLETDGEGEQLSCSYFIPVVDRVHLSGFFDYSINPGEPDRINTETQLNLKIWGDLSLVLEQRYNEYFTDVPSKRVSGWAPGLRYDYRF